MHNTRQPATPATPGRLIRGRQDGLYETQTVAGKVLPSVGRGRVRDYCGASKPARGLGGISPARRGAGRRPDDDTPASRIHRITTLFFALRLPDPKRVPPCVDAQPAPPFSQPVQQPEPSYASAYYPGTGATRVVSPFPLLDSTLCTLRPGATTAATATASMTNVPVCVWYAACVRSVACVHEQFRRQLLPCIVARQCQLLPCTVARPQGRIQRCNVQSFRQLGWRAARWWCRHIKSWKRRRCRCPCRCRLRCRLWRCVLLCICMRVHACACVCVRVPVRVVRVRVRVCNLACC